MVIKLNKEYEKDTMICARATLNHELGIVIAEETFYGFVGANSAYTMDSFVFEEDVAEFKRVFREHDKEPIYIRVRRGDGAWRLCQFCIVNANVVINGESFYEIELRDMVAVNYYFSYMDERINKYRNFLTLVRERFFEYDIKKNTFKIYSYRDNRAEIFENDDLDEWKNRLIRLEQVDKENEPALEQFCASLKSGLDTIKIQFVTSFLRKGERVDTVSFRAQAVYVGGVKTMVVGLIDVINLKSVNKDYYFSAMENNKDSATGLMNKKAVTEFAISRVNYYNNNYKDDLSKTMHMVIIDIDYFKNVNDTYGHMFGDEVIQKFASTLKHVVGDRGVVGRIGGDEFFILLEGIKDDVSLRLILKTIRKKMSFAFLDMTPTYVFTCSIGVSEYRKDASDYETLFRIADMALYIAKDKGRDRFIIFDKAKHGDAVANILTNRKLAASALVSMNPFDKLKMSTRIFDILDREKLNGIMECLEELVRGLDIHAISIYSGSELNCMMTCGVYPKPITNAQYVLNANYIKNFNEIGVFVLNNVGKIAVDCPDAYALLSDSGICSSLQFLIRKDNEVAAVISMDIIGMERRKWSDNDISLIYLIADRIGAEIIK